MTTTLMCPRCDVVLTAEDEDDLVRQVQAHVRADHGLEHTLPRKHILARLRRMPSETDPTWSGHLTVPSSIREG